MYRPPDWCRQRAVNSPKAGFDPQTVRHGPPFRERARLQHARERFDSAGDLQRPDRPTVRMLDFHSSDGGFDSPSGHQQCRCSPTATTPPSQGGDRGFNSPHRRKSFSFRVWGIGSPPVLGTGSCTFDSCRPDRSKATSECGSAW